MNLVHACTLALSLIACAPPLLVAQEKPPAQNAEDRWSWIAPFVDDGTLGVIVVDLVRLEPGPMRTFMTGGVPKDLESAAGGAADAFVGWREGLLAAGATSVAVVLSLKDIGHFPAYIVVRAEGASDVERLRQHVTRERSFGLSLRSEAVLMNNQVLIASPAQREGLGSVARADAMRRAFELVPDAPLRVAFFPADFAKRALEETMPRLPGALGGGETSRLTSGVLAAAVALDHRADTSLALTIACSDEAGAATVRAWLTDRFARLPAEFGGDLRVVAEDVRVRVEVAGERGRSLMTGMGTKVVEARVQASRVIVLSKARAVVMGCWLYAQNNNTERFPAALRSVAEAGFITDDQLQGDDGVELFEYLAPDAEAIRRSPAETIVVYERHGAWPVRGVVVGYVDGHVDILRERAQFERILKASRPAEKPKEPVTTPRLPH